MCRLAYYFPPEKRGGIKIDRKLKAMLSSVYLRQVEIVAVFITTLFYFLFLIFRLLVLNVGKVL